MVQAVLKPISEDEYLAAERDGEVRHEFLHGAVYAMAGGSANHNRVTLNLAGRCNMHSHGDCQTFSSDMKLRLDGGNLFYYPDVMLVCDPRDDDDFFKTSPCMLAEVLSPSTQLTDRREKWQAYQKLPSLREYLLLAQDRPVVEVYKRVNMRQWGLTVLTEDDSLLLDCLELSIPVRELYRGVDFSKPA